MAHFFVHTEFPSAPAYPPGHQSGLKTVNSRHAAAQAAVAAAATAQLHEAASKGDLERVKAAIAAGADVDAKDKVGGSEHERWNVDRGASVWGESIVCTRRRAATRLWWRLLQRVPMWMLPRARSVGWSAVECRRASGGGVHRVHEEANVVNDGPVCAGWHDGPGACQPFCT